MPFDREIHLGYVGPDKVFDFIQRMNLTVVDREDDPVKQTANQFRQNPEGFDISTADKIILIPKLRTAYINTIQAFGWQHGKIVGKNTANDSRYIGIISPWGNREAVVWDLDVYFDPHEVGDSAEEITLGVDLSGRYFPTMLDMKDPHGTMGSVITFNQELLDKVKVCKDELVKEIPELYDAELYVKERFY